MKKISPKKYAQALYELVAERKKEEVESAIREFVRLLAANNDLSKADAIIKEFVRIWNQRQGIVASEVVSAEELDSEMLEKIKTVIKEFTDGEQVELNNQVNKDILGGVIIKYRDKRIDGSLKTQIFRLKNKLYN